MLAKLKTFSLLGIDALPVEVDVSPAGLRKTMPVGPFTHPNADRCARITATLKNDKGLAGTG